MEAEQFGQVGGRTDGVSIETLAGILESVSSVQSELLVASASRASPRSVSDLFASSSLCQRQYVSRKPSLGAPPHFRSSDSA